MQCNAGHCNLSVLFIVLYLFTWDKINVWLGWVSYLSPHVWRRWRVSDNWTDHLQLVARQQDYGQARQGQPCDITGGQHGTLLPSVLSHCHTSHISHLIIPINCWIIFWGWYKDVVWEYGGGRWKVGGEGSCPESWWSTHLHLLAPVTGRAPEYSYYHTGNIYI